MNSANLDKLPFISVISLNWNGRHFLEKLLPDLEAQSYPRDHFEIIVLDNDSTRDDSVNYVEKNFPNIQLIKNRRNDGFAKGCNLAMAQAKGDFLMLVNNDTLPDRNWLKTIVESATHNQHVGAVVSKVLFANRGKGKLINNAGSILYPDRAWPVEEIGANMPDGPEYSKPREITALCGTSLLLSRAMLNNIGLFDESFFMYFEDTDLSWRGQKAGWKFYYCPDSIILHEHSGSSKEHSDFWTFYVTRNRLLIMFKHARISLAIKVYLVFLRDFLFIPVIRGLQGRERRQQLRTFKLGLKIKLSFLWKLSGVLLKRFHLVHERRLSK